jgi:hypothetical protein
MWFQDQEVNGMSSKFMSGAASGRIRAAYLIETPLDPALVADVVAGEQSCGTFVRVAGESDDLRERARANQEARHVKAPKTLRSGEIEKREANASKPATSTTEQTKAVGALPVGGSKAAANEESSSEVSTVKPSKHAKAKAKALRKREAKPEVETEEEEIAVVKPGFWARVKSFFTG